MILRSVPNYISEKVGIILLYTDPAAMGLFFMGAIVLLEKSQKINFSIITCPISTYEYILSKCISLMITSVIVGTIIFILGLKSINAFSLLSIALSSILFSLCGLYVASKISSLNQFAIFTVPFELFICLPAILYILGKFQSDIYILHPGISAIRLLMSNFNKWPLCIISILFWTILMLILTNRSIKKNYFK